MCGEICPDAEYCQICCRTDKANSVVDMIEFVTYGDCNIDYDPIIVLPCGHFYTMTTLDGIFDMSQAYVKSDDEYVDTKIIHRNENIKPKCCPDCRAVVHSVARYGRLLSFLRLQFLERKHLMKIGRSIEACAHKLSQQNIGNDKRKYMSLESTLRKILKNLKNGPTQKVFEACGGNSQVQVPSPPNKSIIQVLQLLGQSYSFQIESSNDEHYQEALNAFEESIAICDDTSSHRLGAEARLSLVKLKLKWNNGLHEGLTNVIDELLENPNFSSFAEIHEEAMKLKATIDGNLDLKPVIEAMHVVDGYDYGGSWTSHWYECPNGHPYFIGNCGGAMETAQCFECGAEIGGNNHRLLHTNKQSDIARKVLDRS